MLLASDGVLLPTGPRSSEKRLFRNRNISSSSEEGFGSKASDRPTKVITIDSFFPSPHELDYSRKPSIGSRIANMLELGPPSGNT
ncbi:hypothetical protein V2G26_010287 [Clonostachys chloroleuca]